MTIERLQSMGYKNVRQFPDGSFAATFQFLYTCAIVHKLYEFGYSDRWCYRCAEEAVEALAAWDGTGEPAGWHRHPASGRRRDPAGNEYVSH